MGFTDTSSTTHDKKEHASQVYEDVVSVESSPDEAVHTRRVLNSRQVQLFAIGGTIGQYYRIMHARESFH